jgi:hypothetical protein
MVYLRVASSEDHSQRIRTATQFQLGIYEAPMRRFTIQPKCDRFKHLNHAVFIVLSAVYPRINASECGSPGPRRSLIALETTQPNFLMRRLCSYDSCHHNLRIIGTPSLSYFSHKVARKRLFPEFCNPFIIQNLRKRFCHFFDRYEPIFLECGFGSIISQELCTNHGAAIFPGLQPSPQARLCHCFT